MKQVLYELGEERPFGSELLRQNRRLDTIPTKVQPDVCRQKAYVINHRKGGHEEYTVSLEERVVML